MDDLPSDMPATDPSDPTDGLSQSDNIPRSPTRVHWIRAALTVVLLAGALTALLGREDPTFFYTAYERLLLAVSPPPTPAAPTPSTPFDLKTAVPLLQQRSLRVSALAAGAPCVAAPARQVSPDLSPALGEGPIYMAAYSAEGTTSYYGAREDEGWYYLKTMWMAPPDFHDVFLLRGRQVDGPNEVRFSEVFTPTPGLEAVFTPDDAGSTGSGWLPWIDYMRVRAPGCYGIQVDGLNFSYIIRFNVLDTP